MKLYFLIAALLLQTPEPRGVVTGTVIASGTSAPIADADVAIVTADGVLETTTDASGRFALADVPAGKQTVLIRADGFFVESTTPNAPLAPRAEVPVTVTSGATPVAIPTVSMVQGGTVSGRVVDPQGHPLPFIRVQALRPDAGTLNSGVLPDFASRMTDDRGEYRMFFVPPGEYVIRAQVQNGRPASPVPPRAGEMQILVDAVSRHDGHGTSRKSDREIRGRGARCRYLGEDGVGDSPATGSAANRGGQDFGRRHRRAAAQSRRWPVAAGIGIGSGPAAPCRDRHYRSNTRCL